MWRRAQGIEHDVGDFLPVVTPILAADDPDGRLERLATDPELAIERRLEQPFQEPVRRMVPVAEPGR